MSRKTLSDELAELANPTPQYVDPEDEYNEETRARLDHYNDEYDNTQELRKETRSKSTLRQKNAGLLADSDSRYAGIRVSRKDLEASSEEDEEDDDEESSENDQSEQYDEMDSEEGDGHIQEFLSMMKVKSAKATKEASDDETDGEGASENLDDEEEDEGEEGEEEGDEEEDGEDEGDDEEVDDEEEDTEGKGAKSSKKSLTSDVEKGRAIQNQLSLWDHLLECRIKLHKGINLANQLPQGPDSFKMFSKVADTNFNLAAKESQLALKTLLDSYLELQNLLLKLDPQTKGLMKNKSKEKKDEESDEEIPSDTEDEAEVGEDDEDPSPPKKRMKLPEYEADIQSKHERYRGHCHRTLHMWNEKTRLASGRAGKGANKSAGFGAFEQSILKQIEIILSDKQRLVNRTRVKRSTYRILGAEPKEPAQREPEVEPAPQEQPEVEVPAVQAKTKPEEEFDPEIYDDDDFYHQLLRELIERRTGEAGSDQVSLGRQWLEIQKLRSKAKRRVDPKASKGRRLRYHVHPKLVSLMAPYPDTSMNDAAKNMLFASLFADV